MGGFTQYAHSSTLKFEVDFCAMGALYVVCHTADHWRQGSCASILFKLGIQVLQYPPPSQKNSSLGVGGFTQYAHSSTLKLEVDLCTLCVMCCLTHFTGSKQRKLCTDFVETWHTSGHLYPPSQKNFQGWVWVVSMETPTRAFQNSTSSFWCFVLCAASDSTQVRKKGSCAPIFSKLGTQVANYPPLTKKFSRLGVGGFHGNAHLSILKSDLMFCVLCVWSAIFCTVQA